MSDAKLIKNWQELSEVPETDEYRIEVEETNGKKCAGWIVNKKTGDKERYLSTHTFYGLNYKHSTSLLRGYGFDVLIDNWDADHKKMIEIIDQPWYTVGEPWSEPDQAGTYIIAGTNDPHAGSFVCDCENMVDDDCFESERHALDHARMIAEHIVKIHNNSLESKKT